MGGFKIVAESDQDADPFDRQRRISWWQQDRVREAKVLVLGAGAIGNEVLKNLALLGCGYIFVADFDTIARSNLSRTVLFRPEDVGRRKAEVAAQRTQELALEATARTDWFHGDIVWDLGVGVFRRFDLVFGCLDNVESRFHTNRRSWLTGTPWIDAGIYELAARVSVYQPPHVPCWECSANPEQLTGVRRRYSCDEFKKRTVAEERVPTVQIAAALVAALQVQEGIKLLCGKPTARGAKIYYQGTLNDFDVIPLPVRAGCPGHVTYPSVVPLPLGCMATVREFLQLVSASEHSGTGAVLRLRDRAFVLDAPCRSCGKPIVLNRPTFRIFDDETLCPNCARGEPAAPMDVSSMSSLLNAFSLAQTPKWILDSPLATIGIPPLHILDVCDPDDREQYYELSADEPIVMPKLRPPATSDSAVEVRMLPSLLAAQV